MEFTKIIQRNKLQYSDDNSYWVTKTPQERLKALEFLRKQAYLFYFYGKGQPEIYGRDFQKVHRIIKRA